ncbi:hypothetical protein EZV62_011499 [Acer yangbiense]|uniref:Protein FAR1-RELATED SEQUENCE n=1 Tax=Acer yangbiense TaxID=1000413 RepID=A0A5C7I5X4_9ROSI|nr:hypothetical protein EZV62_011499 [Acer yangbiense]
MGFGASKTQCRRSKVTMEWIEAKYACTREGTKRKTNALNPRPCLKSNCQALLHVKRREDRKWFVYHFVREHNHELSPTNAHYFPCHRRIAAGVKHNITSLHAVGVKTSKIFAALAKKYKGHAMNVLQSCGVFQIPKHYILKQWSKDANDGHTTTHVLKEADPKKQRFEDLFEKANKLVEEGSVSDQSYKVANRALEEALKKCTSMNHSLTGVKEPNCASHKFHNVDKENVNSNMLSNVLDPKIEWPSGGRAFNSFADSLAKNGSGDGRNVLVWTGDEVLPEKATIGGGPKPKERVGEASSSCNEQVAKVKDGVRWQLQTSDESKKSEVEKSAIMICGRNMEDMTTHMDSYERAVMSDNPIPLNLNFENLVDTDRMANFSNSREVGSRSDKSFQGVLGQEEKLKGEGPSVEKFRVVKAVLSGPPSLFQADRTEPISSSEVFLEKSRGRKSSVLRRSHNRILRSSKACEKTKQLNPKLVNNVAWNLEDEVVKVLEKGMALGFNFNGKKKELIEIIACREDVNDNRFQDLIKQVLLAFIRNRGHYTRESKGFCCADGDISMISNDAPQTLFDLFTSSSNESIEFRKYVCTYNNTFAFTSFGVKYDKNLCKRNKGGPLLLKLIGIDPSSSDGCDSLREIELRLAELARSVNIRFAFRGVAAGGCEVVDASGCLLQPEKALAEIYIQREIVNVVCCEGWVHVKRLKPLAKWRRRLGGAGFRPLHLGSNAFIQAIMLLTRSLLG